MSATTREEPRLAGACGMAEVDAYGAPGGSGAGRILISEDLDFCTRAWFRGTFAHEFGHAMGFIHVLYGFRSVMGLGDESVGREDFTVKERQHARP